MRKALIFACVFLCSASIDALADDAGMRIERGHAYDTFQGWEKN